MTEDSTPSNPPESDANASADVGHFKAIIGIGVMGKPEDAARFTALLVALTEKKAHQINERVFHNRLILLPLPEVELVE